MVKMFLRPASALATVLLVVGCSGASATPTPKPSPSNRPGPTATAVPTPIIGSGASGALLTNGFSSDTCESDVPPPCTAYTKATVDTSQGANAAYGAASTTVEVQEDGALTFLLYANSFNDQIYTSAMYDALDALQYPQAVITQAVQTASMLGGFLRTGTSVQDVRVSGFVVGGHAVSGSSKVVVTIRPGTTE